MEAGIIQRRKSTCGSYGQSWYRRWLVALPASKHIGVYKSRYEFHFLSSYLCLSKPCAGMVLEDEIWFQAQEGPMPYFGSGYRPRRGPIRGQLLFSYLEGTLFPCNVFPFGFSLTGFDEAWSLFWRLQVFVFVLSPASILFNYNCIHQVVRKRSMPLNFRILHIKNSQNFVDNLTFILCMRNFRFCGFIFCSQYQEND